METLFFRMVLKTVLSTLEIQNSNLMVRIAQNSAMIFLSATQRGGRLGCEI